MCRSIGGNVGETWLRRGPIITPPYIWEESVRMWKGKSVGFLPFIVLVFLNIYICVGLMKVNMCFEQPQSTFYSLVLFSLKHPIFVAILVKNHQIIKNKTLSATAKYENLVSNTFTKNLDDWAAQNHSF